MARALLGYVGQPAGNSATHALALEVTRLRRRVLELETELEQLRSGSSAESSTIDIELHQITEAAEPALA